MNFFRTFLDSVRERVTSVKTYISILVFGDSSISSVIVHKPFPEDATDATQADEEDIFHDAVEEEEEFYYRWMYRMYLNMTKVVKYRRWTFAEYKTVLTNFKLD